MSAITSYIVDRLKEPSTWAGFGLIGTAVQQWLTAGSSNWLQLAIGVLGAVAAATPQASPKP